MIIISGSSNAKLAREVSNLLNCEFIKSNTKVFQDTELNVRIEGEISGKDAIIFQSLNRPVNYHLMELLLLIDATKRSNAKKIKVVIPYFAYSRQNNIEKNSSLAIDLVIKLIEAAGAESVFTLDLHNKDIEKLFKIEITNISSFYIFYKYFQNCQENLVIVSPDIGGKERAKEFAHKLGCDFALINKTRTGKSSLKLHLSEGNIKGRNCLIIDDIVDSANTLCNVSEFLIKHSALSVKACVTHPVLSSNAVEKIKNSSIKELLITDSIQTKKLPEKIKVISCSKILSSMFDKKSNA